MPTFELLVLLLTLVSLLLGGISICWARGEDGRIRTRWGRRLFVITLLLLGAVGSFAATLRSGGLPPLGILAGLLIVAMLWEGPKPHLEQSEK